MTARFTLTIIDADHAIISTEVPLTREEAHEVQRAFARWKEDGGTLVISDCAVSDLRQIEVELGVLADVCDRHPGKTQVVCGDEVCSGCSEEEMMKPARP